MLLLLLVTLEGKPEDKADIGVGTAVDVTAVLLVVTKELGEESSLAVSCKMIPAARTSCIATGGASNSCESPRFILFVEWGGFVVAAE